MMPVKLKRNLAKQDMKVLSADSELVNGYMDWEKEIGITLNSKDDDKWLIWALPAVRGMWKIVFGLQFQNYITKLLWLSLLSWPFSCSLSKTSFHGMS